MLFLPYTDGQAAHPLKVEIESAVEGSNQNAHDSIRFSMEHSTNKTLGQWVQDAAQVMEEHQSCHNLLTQNNSHWDIVSSIMTTLYAKSQETQQHSQRLGKLCQMIGKQLGMGQQDLDDLWLLSMLHDIGKVGIDDRILNKPGKLNDDEWNLMKLHPEIGYRIVIQIPHLKHIARYILYHHERWDGAGYPAGLKGQEIPILSRVLSVADAFDAMTEDRVYRKAMPRAAAIQEIRRNSGTQFDPDIISLLVGLIKNKGG